MNGPCHTSTGPRRHRCSTWHAWLVESYRCARNAWLDRAEIASSLYPAELDEFATEYPPPTFKQFLVDTRNPERH